jgi:hypothetical protein
MPQSSESVRQVFPHSASSLGRHKAHNPDALSTGLERAVAVCRLQMSKPGTERFKKRGN